MANFGYWICYPFAALLRLFYTLTNSYGVSLIFFTLVITLLLLPLQMKSKKSMVRMNRMSGKMQEIQKKYANNKERLSEELQKLYAEEGANPMSGCLWAMLPMPILFALYYVIREPIVFFMNFGSRTAGRSVLLAAKKLITDAGITISGSAAYEQIQISNIINSKFPEFAAKHAGWINVDYKFMGLDLSALPTSAFKMLKNGVTWTAIGLLLIPIISGLLQLLVSKISMSGQATPDGAAGKTNKMMIYMMPLFSVYIGFILPAALGIYWIAQSGFSAIREAVLGKFYNGKLEVEEDERQRKIEEKRHQRQEEAKKLQLEQRKVSVKQQAVSKKKAIKAAQEASKKKKSRTNENGRVGDRPYARGRAYSEDHYQRKQNNGKN